MTHALREHKTVYAQWLRVLKPEGILLIFDANWHLPYQRAASGKRQSEENGSGWNSITVAIRMTVRMNTLTAR